MDDDWRELMRACLNPRESDFVAEFTKKYFYLRTEKLADEEAPPAPKPLPAAVNKWEGEDEDDDIKASSRIFQCILLK